MNLEIERKFLLKDDSWKNSAIEFHEFRQSYFSSGNGPAIRIRIADSDAYLTIKSPSKGISRAEFEYKIPLADAELMLKLFCGSEIVKRRWIVPYENFSWEIDEFHGANEGLVVAEIELASAEQQFPIPPWLGQEVSTDLRYRNTHLLKSPYSLWKDK